jgi:hypothetical protein
MDSPVYDSVLVLNTGANALAVNGNTTTRMLTVKESALLDELDVTGSARFAGSVSVCGLLYNDTFYHLQEETKEMVWRWHILPDVMASGYRADLGSESRRWNAVWAKQIQAKHIETKHVQTDTCKVLALECQSIVVDNLSVGHTHHAYQLCDKATLALNQDSVTFLQDSGELTDEMKMTPLVVEPTGPPGTRYELVNLNDHSRLLQISDTVHVTKIKPNHHAYLFNLDGKWIFYH